MLRLKSCPKCGGDVRIDRDQYGWYEQCIQCAHIQDLEPFNIISKSGKRGQIWKDEGHTLKPIEPLGLNDYLREDNAA